MKIVKIDHCPTIVKGKDMIKNTYYKSVASGRVVICTNSNGDWLEIATGETSIAGPMSEWVEIRITQLEYMEI